MNNFIYATEKPERIAPKVEKLICQDLKISGDLPYRLVRGEEQTLKLDNVLQGMGQALLGGRTKLLFRLDFELIYNRPVQLEVSVNRLGVGGAHLGSLLYLTRLVKPIKGEVCLEEPKAFQMARFIGEPVLAERLNKELTLLKQVNQFARTSTKVGSYTLKVPRLFQVTQIKSETWLVGATLPTTKFMGLAKTMNVSTFIDLAAQLEMLL